MDAFQLGAALLVALPLILAAISNMIVTLRTSSKVDANTLITEKTKQESTAAFETLARLLDGGLDNRVKEIVQVEVASVREVLSAHAKTDDENMLEIRAAIIDLTKAVKASA